MKYLLVILVLFITTAQGQSVHKFIKTGSTFTYQLNNNVAVTYGAVKSSDIPLDTSKIRIALDDKNYIVIQRTDVIQVAGVTITGSIYQRRLAIVSVFPPGDYTDASSPPVAVTDLYGNIMPKVKIYPQGKMLYDNPLKTLYLNGTTDTAGLVKFFLTEDNTGSGAAIFNTLNSVIITPVTSVPSPDSVVHFFRKQLPGSLKFVTYGFYTGANNMVGAGYSFKFQIEGL